MKTTLRTKLTLLTSIIAISLFSQSDKLQPGLFETKEDFLNGKVKYVGECEGWSKSTFSPYKVIFMENGKKVKYKLKDSPYFGYRDNQGRSWRISDGEPYGVLQMGKIIMYAQSIYKRPTSMKGDIKTVYDPFTIYFSKEIGGPLISANSRSTVKQLEEWFREDDKALANRFHNESFIMSGKAIINQINYVTEYNEKYSK